METQYLLYLDDTENKRMKWNEMQARMKFVGK